LGIIPELIFYSKKGFTWLLVWAAVQQVLYSLWMAATDLGNLSEKRDATSFAIAARASSL